MAEKYVPDTTVIIDGKLSQLIESGELEGITVLIAEAVMVELEAMSNAGKYSGFTGLREVALLRSFGEKGRINIEFTSEDVPEEPELPMDALVRKVALPTKWLAPEIQKGGTCRTNGWLWSYKWVAPDENG